MGSGTTAVDRLLHRNADALAEPFFSAMDDLTFAPEAPFAALLALGVTVPNARKFEMAILPVAPTSADVAGLACVLGISIAEAACGLRRPGGLVMRDLSADRAQRLDHRIRKVPGVQVELSEPKTAIYDLFGRVGGPLQRDLERLALLPCPATGAAAAGLDCGMADWLRRRHGRIAVDRRFQRFDLVLCDLSQMPRDRIADFIGLRAGITRSAILTMPSLAAIRLEVGLRRAVARQFAMDYAMIGLSVRLRLAGTEVLTH